MEKNIELETTNKELIKNALAESAHDFTLFFKNYFIEDVEWTIAGHGPVAATYYDMKSLFEKAESALFRRLAQPLTIKTLGVWADEDQVFARIKSASLAIDGQPYQNEYMYIMTIENGKVVSGIEWLDLNAYYEIVNRIVVD